MEKREKVDELHPVSSIQALRVLKSLCNAELGDLLRVKADKSEELGLEPEKFYQVCSVDLEIGQIFINTGMGVVVYPLDLTSSSSNFFEIVGTAEFPVQDIATDDSPIKPAYGVRVQCDPEFPNDPRAGVWFTADGWLYEVQIGAGGRTCYPFPPRHHRNAGMQGLRPMTVHDI